MKINKFRSKLYKTAKVLGDVNAVQKGKVTRRIGVRVVGKMFGQLMRKIFGG